MYTATAHPFLCGTNLNLIAFHFNFGMGELVFAKLFISGRILSKCSVDIYLPISSLEVNE